MGLYALNTGTFLILFYTPVVSETRAPNPASGSTSRRPKSHSSSTVDALAIRVLAKSEPLRSVIQSMD